MEPEGSEPCSQQPAIDAYPETDESSPHPPTPLPEDIFSYYLPIYAQVIPVLSSLRVFQPKYGISHLSHVCYILHPSILLDFITRIYLLQ
jgi:hypothetical protein